MTRAHRTIEEDVISSVRERWNSEYDEILGRFSTEAEKRGDPALAIVAIVHRMRAVGLDWGDLLAVARRPR